MDSFGSFLKEKREQKRFSLQDLSDLLGQKEKEIGWYPDKSRLSRWETGRALPTAKHRPVLLAMAKILDMEPAEESEWLVKAGLPPLQTEELDMSTIDSTLSSMGERRRKAWFLHKYLGWDIGRISSKLKAPSWDIQRDIEEVKDELERLVGKVENLSSIAEQLKAQLYIPPPETILIHDFARPGHYPIYPKQDVFRVVCKDLGYDTREFTATKEHMWIPPSHEIDVVVSLYGDLQLCYPVEEASLFQNLLSSLPQVAREQFSTLKLDGGGYLTKCISTCREIHNEASARTFQSAYEEGSQILPKLGRRPLEAEFGNLVYQLCILYCRTSDEFGLPDKSHYQIRRRGLIFGELYLGQILLANAPLPPSPPPGFPPLPNFLDTWAKLHRDMIRKWSASPAIIELLELFERLHGIEEAIKQELNEIIRGK